MATSAHNKCFFQPTNIPENISIFIISKYCKIKRKINNIYDNPTIMKIRIFIKKYFEELKEMIFLPCAEIYGAIELFIKPYKKAGKAIYLFYKTQFKKLPKPLNPKYSPIHPHTYNPGTPPPYNPDTPPPYNPGTPPPHKRIIHSRHKPPPPENRTSFYSLKEPNYVCL